jgi:hypothetical protein
MPVCIMAMKCRSRTVVIMESVSLYPIQNDGVQTNTAKLIYRDTSCLLKGYLEFLIENDD